MAEQTLPNSAERLLELKNLTAKAMNESYISLFFEKTSQLYHSLCVPNSTKLPTNISHFAELLACVRTVIGDAEKGRNERNAHQILVNIQKNNFLAHLIDSFNTFCDHFRHHFDDFNEVIPEELLKVVLRLEQVFYNILNLRHIFGGDDQFKEFVNIFVPLYDVQRLNFIFSLRNHKEPTARLSKTVLDYCRRVVFTFTAFLYISLLISEEVQKIMTAQEMNFIWEHQLDICKDELSEFSLWAIFLALKREHFLQTMYCYTSSENRFLLLDITLECISSKDDSKRQWNTPEDYQRMEKIHEKVLPDDAVWFMIEKVKEEIDDLLSVAGSGDVDGHFDEEKIRLLCRLCSLLLKVSSNDDYLQLVQQEQCLLEALVKLLKNIQLWAINSPESVFGIRGQLKDVNLDAESASPAYGFKRDIIGLIANIIHLNKAAQNYLRTSEGLAALLDCAKIDARNPFILQWSIFAIHNALEKNAENQQFVAQMQKQGILKDELVNQINSKAK